MIRLITPAAGGPVTLESVKEHLRVTHSDEDALIESYIAAAVAFVSKRLQLALADGTYEEWLDAWPVGPLELAIGPVRDVRSIAYVDEDGNLQLVAEANWRWSPTDLGAQVWLLSTYSLPTLQDDAQGIVRIQFDAGFDDPDATGSGDDPRLTMPAEAVQAVMLMAAHFYEHREAASAPELAMVPLAVEALIGVARTYR